MLHCMASGAFDRYVDFVKAHVGCVYGCKRSDDRRFDGGAFPISKVLLVASASGRYQICRTYGRWTLVLLSSTGRVCHGSADF